MVTVLALVVVSLIVLFVGFDKRTSSAFTSGMSSFTHTVFSPIRRGAVDSVSPIGSFFAGAVQYGSLQSENQKMEATAGELKMERAERSFEENQYRQVEALQKVHFLASGTGHVTAEVVDVSTSAFTSTITVDKGLSAGVDVGMPVVVTDGLVGQVIQSSKTSAVVQLINDGQSKVGVTFGAANECSNSPCTGTVTGQGPGEAMTLDLVPANTSVHKGEELYTGDLDGASYPSNIPVATITSFRNRPGANQETIAITPRVDLSRVIFYVDIVLWEPAP
jgi:rod shape-determining protein MreC